LAQAFAINPLNLNDQPIAPQVSRAAESFVTMSYPDACTIAVKPGAALELGAEVPVLVSVKTPQGARTPSDVCCVLDVSGSMGAEATIMGAGGTAESHGLSLLDVAKHGLRTVIKTCSRDDRLTIVTFNNTATTVLPLTVMDEAGQQRAEEQLEAIQAGGGTNIWNGLFAGMEALRTDVAAGRLAHVMLLTDGESQEREKIVPNLLEYKKSYERLPGTISTFGFGYNIDSNLLVNLAAAGDGSYSFIPDAGFVGTVFVNTLSNLLVTMAREVYLALEAEEGAEMLGISGGYQLEDVSSGGKRVNLGTLQYEQTKDFIVFMRVTGPQPYLIASGNFEGVGGVAGSMPMAEGVLDVDKMEVGAHVCRARYVDTVQQVAAGLLQAGSSLEEAQGQIAALAAFIEQNEAAGTPPVMALLEDVKGQTTEAISKADWYRKWGRHYVPSIMFAHKLQQCNNFKDPGVQLYGGPLFQNVQELGDDIFNKLPAPKPSIQRASQVSASRAAPVSMAAYNDRYAGCIDGSCQVNLAGGETRFVRDLKQGDVVESPEGYSAEVVCLVRTLCRGGRAHLVELPGGARLTPYHPVMHEGSWVFPADVAEVSEQPCDSVYNLVLRGAAAVVVAGVPCVALGHGIEEGAAKHPYFGQQQAVEDVMKFPRFEAGFVQLSPGWAVRDEVTGIVCGMRPDAMA